MIFDHIESKTERILTENSMLFPGFDVYELVKKLNLNIEGKSLSDDVSGLLVIKANKAYIIYNNDQNSKRKRFTIAHELGHFYLHSKTKPLFVDRSKKVMYRNNDSSTGEFMKEREANAFAAALLMPRCLIIQHMEISDDSRIVQDLAARFKVSTQAMSFRLSNLGYELGMY